MTEFIGLDHVQLPMAPGGEDAARAFYHDVLGLTEIAPPPPLRGLWFRAGNVELHLHVEANHEPSTVAHPGMQVRGLRELADRCAAAGFEPRFDTRYPGRSRFYVKDAFGNLLELLELLELDDDTGSVSDI
jgi:catechol 2,3-dioxygenase-like lactoylglutathione lyase family enzyme